MNLFTFVEKIFFLSKEAPEVISFVNLKIHKFDLLRFFAIVIRSKD